MTAAIMDTVNSLPLILVSAMFFYRLLESRRPFTTFLFVLGIPQFIGILFITILPPALNFGSAAEAQFDLLIDAVDIVVTICLLAVLTDQPMGRIIIYYCFYKLMTVSGTLFALLCIGLLTGAAPSEYILTTGGLLRYHLLSKLFAGAFLFLSMELMAKKIRRNRSDIRWGVVCAVGCSQLVSIFVIGSLMDVYGSELSAPLYAGMLFIDISADIALFRTFNDFSESSELKTALQNLEDQQALQKEYYLAAADQLRITQRNRHDFKNMLLTVDLLLEKGEVERAQRFANEFRSNLNSHVWVMFTGNEIIDAVLNKKAQEAAAEGFAFDAQLLLPDPFPLKDFDSMSLFSNILDNAIEHMRLLPPESDHTIAVSSAISAGFFLIRVSNACAREDCRELPLPATSKGDAVNHGHGLGIVKEIAERYDGGMRLSIRNGRFVVSVMINLYGNE